MLWLALYCPTLSLDCLLRRWPSGVEPALAISDVDGTRRFVAAASRTAEACGVFAGQSVATALALLPDLLVVARKLEEERRALTEAALAALRFTPTVSLRASGLVMEVSASLRLFGGRRALKKDLAQAMRSQGLGVATAEGPTPHGAWLLAKEKARRRLLAARMAALPATARRAGAASAARSSPPTPATFEAALDAVPIGHLESLGPSARRMDGLGCFTLADLRRLPVAGLARRFGQALVDELARAVGERPDPQPVFEAPSRFDARIELMARAESTGMLEAASHRLIGQLGGWLAARRAAVRGFTLILHHERWTRDAIEPTPVDIALATPSSDVARLTTLVGERLGRLELKAPVQELSLEAPRIVDEEETGGSLFPARDAAIESLARLFEKMTARLGTDAMARIERVADHRPERAWREVRGDLLEERLARTPARKRPASGRPKEPADAGGDTDPDTGVAHRPMTPGCSCGPRPAWLMTEPIALEVRFDQPFYDGEPLQRILGPERIETGWWDDAPATRDYFIAENPTGRLVWIYRERLPQPERPSWYLQGLFG